MATQLVNKECNGNECECTYVPRADIVEGAQAFTIQMDMPGVDQNSVDLNVEKNVLTVHGKIAGEASSDDQSGYREFEQGDYKRVFVLSDDISVDGIEAQFKDGVLKVVLPKSEKSKPKKIVVRAN